jgi:hypothetical protein
MSDETTMSRFLEELDKLLKAASTQEQRNEIWIAVFKMFHEVSDDEQWASIRKQIDGEVAKKGRH